MIDETVEEIEDMQTHSSSEVAVKAARALEAVTDAEYATVEEYGRSLERNCRALRHANPSHATLYSTMQAIEAAVAAADPATVEAAKGRTLAAIDEEVDRITAAKGAAAAEAAARLEDGGSYLTLDFSTTVLEAVETVVADGDASVSVTVLESRPRYLGRKMARRLATIEGVEPKLVVDGAMGHAVEACDRVLVGITCVVDDTLYNRTGTYPLAVVADRAGVPMHAVGSRRKVVDDTFVFENEHRPSSEVSLEPLEGVAVENLAYDATPVSLLASVLTDEGALFE